MAFEFVSRFLNFVRPKSLADKAHASRETALASTLKTIKDTEAADLSALAELTAQVSARAASEAAAAKLAVSATKSAAIKAFGADAFEQLSQLVKAWAEAGDRPAVQALRAAVASLRTREAYELGSDVFTTRALFHALLAEAGDVVIAKYVANQTADILPTHYLQSLDIVGRAHALQDAYSKLLSAISFTAVEVALTEAEREIGAQARVPLNEDTALALKRWSFVRVLDLEGLRHFDDQTAAGKLRAIEERAAAARAAQAAEQPHKHEIRYTEHTPS